MSVYEDAQADRQETTRLHEALRRRFGESPGDGRRFDALHLRAAAVRRAERIIDAQARARGGVERPATEHEVRLALLDLTRDAIVARSGGRLHVFRRGLSPWGPPSGG